MTDKETLILALNDISEILNNNGHGGLCVAIRKAVSMLKEQEARKGHWIEDETETYTENHDTWECSECGHAQILIEGTPKENDYHYCPNCGAKMDE